jgi:hypothetical protein
VLALRVTASGPVSRLLLERSQVLRADADGPARIAAQGLDRLASEVVADATRTGTVAAGGLTAAWIGLLLVARVRSRAGSG